MTVGSAKNNCKGRKGCPCGSIGFIAAPAGRQTAAVSGIIQIGHQRISQIGMIAISRANPRAFALHKRNRGERIPPWSAPAMPRDNQCDTTTTIRIRLIGRSPAKGVNVVKCNQARSVGRRGAYAAAHLRRGPGDQNAYLFDRGTGAVGAHRPDAQVRIGLERGRRLCTQRQSVAGLLETRPLVASITVVNPALVVPEPSASN